MYEACKLRQQLNVGHLLGRPCSLTRHGLEALCISVAGYSGQLWRTPTLPVAMSKARLRGMADFQLVVLVSSAQCCSGLDFVYSLISRRIVVRLYIKSMSWQGYSQVESIFLNTPIRVPFSRAAATLSLSPSCLFTASSVLCVPFLMRTSIR